MVLSTRVKKNHPGHLNFAPKSGFKINVDHQFLRKVKNIVKNIGGFLKGWADFKRPKSFPIYFSTRMSKCRQEKNLKQTVLPHKPDKLCSRFFPSVPKNI